MAVQAAVARPSGSMHVGLLGIVLIAAAAFSAGIGLGATNWLVRDSRTDAVSQPAPAFNAPGFRLGEKLSLTQVAPGFNAPGFRLDEKLPLAQPAPGFVAPGLQLQEKVY
jgi:hypothetical protein